MSLEQKLLRNEMASYARGDEPPADMLAVAPTMHGWAAAIALGPTGEYEMTLIGRVADHPIMLDGRELTTSPVLWLDRKGRWARAQDRLWKLGEPEGSEIPVDGIDA